MYNAQAVNLRLLEGDRERIELLTKRYALNAASLLRMLLKREADAVLQQQPEPQQSP